MKKVVEAGLSARYEDALELVKRGEEALPFISRYIREDIYWYEDERHGCIAECYAPIRARTPQER